MATAEELEEYAELRRINFTEAMSRYDVVSAHHDPAYGSFVVLADKVSTTAEFGYASPSPWTSWTRTERVPELRDRTGLRTYYDMKRADGTVRGSLRLLKTPVMAARWFVEPFSDSKKDKKVSDFVEKNLFEELNVPWVRVVEDSLLMCEYGHMPLEKVWFQDEGKTKLQKLAPRHPLDIMEWEFDANGGPSAIRMFPGGPEDDGAEYIDIPIEKLVVFVLEEEAGDIKGISILRSAYKHYYYKDTFYKIDAIQKERHGVGVPIIKLNPGYSDDDRKAAEDLGRNLRTNEKGHIVAPANWEVMFAELKGQPVDCLASINHHDMKIKSNILAPFMDESNIRPDSLDIFFKAARYIAGTICDTFNHHVIRQLVDMNFNVDGYPKLRVRRIGEWEDIRTMSFAYRNFVGAGTIVPDDDLEAFVRQLLDLPPADKATARVQPTPQAPGQEMPGKTPQVEGKPGQPTPPRVGPPRQAQNAPVGPPQKNAGRDVSGGK